jgi:hypothetical protein
LVRAYLALYSCGLDTVLYRLRPVLYSGRVFDETLVQIGEFPVCVGGVYPTLLCAVVPASLPFGFRMVMTAKPMMKSI